MADISHPEVDVFTTIEEADALVVVCHPVHEEALRDAIAVEQERPQWWRDMRAIEEAISRG